ncbi:hypothetical protein Q3G72_033489 [Acer saccharum]|nr:hypothetical protein Q3G72_033489 [Acer saccharum]
MNMYEGSPQQKVNYVEEVASEVSSQIAKPCKGGKKMTKKNDKVSNKKNFDHNGAGCSKGFKEKYLVVQPMLVQETETEQQDSASVLWIFHNEVKEFESKCMEEDDGDALQLNSLIESSVPIENNFDKVASDLEEAMAVISK